MDDVEGGVARLAVTRILRADPSGLCRALRDPSWLGRVVGPSPDRAHLQRVETDLAFRLSDVPGTLTFRKAALVDVGVESLPDGSCRGEIEWRAATFAPLFPMFAGLLTVHHGGLHLEGAYAPPGGGMGLLVDRSLLHHFADRTAIWFLDRLTEELATGPVADDARRP